MASSAQLSGLQAFMKHFGTPPSVVVRAPGRVNIIGEHTDYNDGYVLPMTIDRATWVSLRPRDDDQVCVRALAFDDQQAEFRLGALASGDGPPWANYVKAAAWALQEAGHSLRGWEGVISGDVPLGAGLSSSASVILATARAFAHISGLRWDAVAQARLAQAAEGEWVGVKTGIMDQMVIAAGRSGQALLIDCRSLSMKAVTLPSQGQIVVLDTGTRRELAHSAYNERREQCAQAARAYGVSALRDLSPSRFDKELPGMDPLVFRRARHVVTENARVLLAVEMLRGGALSMAGKLLAESHASLRDDYEVSSPALDAMVAAAQAHPACLGARMTGAGFGGCAVALVHADQTEAFIADTLARYHADTGLTPDAYAVRATPGAEVVRA